MPSFYINTYAPLVSTPAGLNAVERFGYPPFADYSIRREPDLEHDYPSITCICRGENFAPRLRSGDVVAYLTMKGAYQAPERHWRLTSILKVIEVFPTHRQAAGWYGQQGLSLPSNCMVPENPPLALAQSSGACRGQKKGCGRQSQKAWDSVYLARITRNGTFVVCQSLKRDLSWSAPAIFDQDWENGLGLRPSRNPRRQDMSDYLQFQNYLRNRSARIGRAAKEA